MKALPPSVSLIEAARDYPVYEIRHAKAEARIAAHGAHVMNWKPASATHEVVYLSPDAILREGKAIRGGIPICWPWFNAHPSDPKLPSHGYARDRFWELREANEDENGVQLVFTLDLPALNAELRIACGETLDLTLTTRNNGPETIALSGALHSYFSVSNIREVVITGLAESDYLDTVGKRTPRHQNGDVRISEEVDRIYHSVSAVTLHDPTWKRAILIEKSGSPSTVIWNPWIEKAAALGDLPDEAYEDFVCIESAIANESAIALEPGQSHGLSTRISLID
ncbi:D-hexose-6-phosphate mutarotase [Haloferula chungangensis]|uniref:Putative glucose-6-phosphate 1-epimerase n=1 Tax=Haloferula chungangensis TaxID=1048331 RepID=A0ABW2LCF5_9BACT